MVDFLEKDDEQEDSNHLGHPEDDALLVRYLCGALGGRDGSRRLSRAAADVTDSRSSMAEFETSTKLRLVRKYYRPCLKSASVG